MGPLFSAALAVVVLTVGLVVVFIVARFFWKPTTAIRVAALFIIGGAVSVILTGLLLSPFIGGTLTSSARVISYLSTLAFGGLLGGGFVSWLYIKASRSNSSFNPDAQKRRAG